MVLFLLIFIAFLLGFYIKALTNDNLLDSYINKLISIAKSKDIKVHERKILPTELSNFTGCFLTGTAAEVTPVSCIAKNQFKVCKTIIDLNESYQALVRKKKAA